MGGVAGGMIIGSAIKLASSLRSNPFGLASLSCAKRSRGFLMIALLRWPLVWVLLGLGIPACPYAWSKVVHDRSGYEDPTSAQDKPLLTDKDPLQ